MDKVLVQLKLYLGETKKIYYSLLFILPFFIFYEIGFFKHSKNFTMNFGDALLRSIYYFLNSIFGSIIMGIVMGASIIGLLIYLIKYFKKFKPKIQPLYFLGMLLEVILICFGYVVLTSLVYSHSWPSFFTFKLDPAVAYQAKATGMTGFWAILFGSVGAGVFEELVFRVMALRLLYEILKPKGNTVFGSDMKTFMVAAVIISVVFALLHLSQVISLFSLFSIFISSIFLSFLYLFRGYGIVAGFHIFWDIFGFLGIT